MIPSDLPGQELPAESDLVPTSLPALLSLHDARFVRAAYQCILRRPADASGFSNYLARVRGGVPKAQIVQELAQSDEGRRVRSDLPGLSQLPPLAGPGGNRLARLVDRIFRRGLTPLQHRANALDNSLGALSDELYERLNHLQWTVSRLEARLAGSMERLHAQRAPLAPASEPAADTTSGNNAGPLPVILELAYSRTASPMSLGLNSDTRQLAVGFRRIDLVELGTGDTLCRLDLREGGNSARSALFGFSAAESWGSWSNGAKSALALWLPRPPRGGLKLLIEGSVFDAGFPTVDIDATASLGHQGRATLVAGTGSVEIILDAPARDRARTMFFGQMSAAPDPRNVSLSDDQPEVSVVILNFNKPVLSVLSALATATSRIGVPYEVLVVDNGSQPENWKTLEQLNTVARLVRIPVNRYFGEGNNIGVEQARGRYLLFLNNDAFPSPGCVDELLRAFELEPDCGAACPVFLYPDGRMQEAGAFVRPDGTAYQRGKQEPDFDLAALPRFDAVDYGSAACLLMRADDFRRVGGFNYRYDPAYYEDTDLCMRLQLIGKRVWLARDARCTHIENATTADKQHVTVSSNVVDLNRRVFLSSWQDFLKARNADDLPVDLLPPSTPLLPVTVPTQATFSPFPLTPGGGERYLLATAEVLAGFGETAFGTADVYSQFRLDNVMADLGLPVGRVRSRDWSSLHSTKLERLVVMGNECLPRVAPQAARSHFHCQFPFPWPEAGAREIADGIGWLKDYRSIIVNSDFTRRAVLSALARHGVSAQVDIVFPPVGATRLLDGGLARRKAQILSIGRFTDRGHAKRHDVLIEALKATSPAFRRDWTLVLCGSVPNDPHAKAYFERLQASVGTGLNVEFVIAPTRQTLDRLLWESAVYAHATGFGVSSADEHWRCEHFGITIVEALAAGCATHSFGVGGGPEIARLTGAGTTFLSVEELAHQFECATLEPIALSSREKAVKLFGDEAFRARMALLLN
jgi:O-antigen biosynthesis protein